MYSWGGSECKELLASLDGREATLKMQPHDTRNRPEVVVYHSAYGLRPAIIEFAARLRAAGLLVHTPDLYDGEVFSDRKEAIRKLQALGFDKLLERAVAAVESLPHDLVYAGFSNGGVCAELLAATRLERGEQS